MLYTNLISCGISQLGVGIGIPLLPTIEKNRIQFPTFQALGEAESFA